MLSIRTNLIRLKITEIIPILISITTQNLQRNKHCHFKVNQAFMDLGLRSRAPPEYHDAGISVKNRAILDWPAIL